MAEAEQSSGNSETIDSLASFLADNPDADASGPALEKKAKQPPATADTGDKDADEEDAPDPADEDSESAADKLAADKEDEDKGEEDDENPEQQGLKFKITVKGDDGADTTIEVDQKELVAGYQRHADYTRKTQELSQQRQEITTQAAKHIEEGRNYYLQQAHTAHAAISRLASLKTPEEMAQLAAADPAAWVQENQRAALVGSVLSQIEQGMQAEVARQQAEHKAMQAQIYQQTWETLNKEGIDRPKLKKIFDVMQERYKVPAERIANINDPILIRIMRDAAAFQDLQDRKPAVTKKLAEAPKLPAARQSVTRKERINKQLNSRFAGGKGKVDDLAAFISLNNL
jgi:hypothetical protein